MLNPILDAGAVVIDGVDGVMQKLCYLRRVVDAQTYEGKDAYVGGELVLLLGVYLHVGLQQGVKAVDEVGEQVQENGVEVLVELFYLLLLQFGRFGHTEQLVELFVLHLSVHHLTVVVELVDVL